MRKFFHVEVRRIKDGYGAPQFVPRVVILDPELTVHTPQWLWASTGLRAVDHAVERIYMNTFHYPVIFPEKTVLPTRDRNRAFDCWVSS